MESTEQAPTVTVVAVTDPKWADAAGTLIDVMVTFDGLPGIDGPVPFTANDGADTDYGQLIWDNAIAGAYGSIAAYAPPPPIPYTLDVMRLWERMTDQEAEDFDAAMSTASPLRLRRAFGSASALVSGTELFLFVEDVLKTVVSAERAGQILGE